MTASADNVYTPGGPAVPDINDLENRVRRLESNESSGCGCACMAVALILTWCIATTMADEIKALKARVDALEVRVEPAGK